MNKGKMEYEMLLRIWVGVSAIMLTCATQGETVRTDFVNTSHVNRRQANADARGYDIRGTTPFAFALAPKLECPAEDSAVCGLRFNLFVGEHVDVYGLDLGLFGNFVKREIGGVQIAGLFNIVGESDGALQLAPLFNDCRGVFKGLQIGLVNHAEKVSGVQIGLINHANIMYGLQIGVGNMIESSSFPLTPIVNFAF